MALVKLLPPFPHPSFLSFSLLLCSTCCSLQTDEQKDTYRQAIASVSYFLQLPRGTKDSTTTAHLSACVSPILSNCFSLFFMLKQMLNVGPDSNDYILQILRSFKQHLHFSSIPRQVWEFDTDTLLIFNRSLRLFSIKLSHQSGSDPPLIFLIHSAYCCHPFPLSSAVGSCDQGSKVWVQPAERSREAALHSNRACCPSNWLSLRKGHIWGFWRLRSWQPQSKLIKS